MKICTYILISALNIYLKVNILIFKSTLVFLTDYKLLKPLNITY